MKGIADRAASSAALAVEDEVTFCGTQFDPDMIRLIFALTIAYR